MARPGVPVPSLLCALLLASGCASGAGRGRTFPHKKAFGLKTVALLTVLGSRRISRFDLEDRELKSGDPERAGQELLDLLAQELAAGLSKRGLSVVPPERVPAEFAKLYPATRIEDVKERLRSKPGMGSEELERLVKMLASLRGSDVRPGENPSPRNGTRTGKQTIDDAVAHGTVDLYAPEVLFDGRAPRLRVVRDKEAKRRSVALARALKADGYLLVEADYVQRRPVEAAQGAVAGCVVWVDLYDQRGRLLWEGVYPAFSDEGYGLMQYNARKEDHLRLGTQALRNAVRTALADWDAGRGR